MNIETSKNMQKAIQRGIITKDTLQAYIERSEAFMERYGEYPKLNIAKGADLALLQYEKQIFEKELGIQVVMDHEMGLISLTNTISNTMETIEYDHDYSLVDVKKGGDEYTVSVERPVVSSACEQDYPHLANRLSKIRIVNNGGESIMPIMRDLKSVDPTALWVEKNDVDDHFFLNKVIGKGAERAAFKNEFEGNLGPKVLKVNCDNDYGDNDMSL